MATQGDLIGRVAPKSTKTTSRQSAATTMRWFPYERIWSFEDRLESVSAAGDGDAVPNKLFLDQNYPNPFNPTTMIRYGLPNGTNVKITVHTLLGNQIKVLVDQWQDPGIYTYDFSAVDLPSGAYFYRMQTSLGTITRRMMVSK